MTTYEYIKGKRAVKNESLLSEKVEQSSQKMNIKDHESLLLSANDRGRIGMIV
jgi:hypothetical protein